MEVPLSISFDGIDHSDAIEARIREEADKLEHLFDHIVSARVVVTRPQRRHHKGDVYQVRIHLVVPDAADIVVSREPGVDGAHEDMYVTIRDAFKAARRQLKDTATAKRAGH
ncbi:MAG: HPF/RaiA family ribosome-associated protein [Rhodomicrobium sp.]|jgi:ribosome-associated translation inhibitor RaiA